MGADLVADNPQALILLPCGRFPGNPFPVARDGAVKPVCIDTTQEQLMISTGEQPLYSQQGNEQSEHLLEIEFTDGDEGVSYRKTLKQTSDTIQHNNRASFYYYQPLYDV